uniref:Cytochrome P450 n=1 Tax=Phanerodontia chrysosporium TaxID=2822231 RepID=G5EJN2_PHACH|nr:cytochrome P450 [Phanerodontia chrysosporium]
MELWFDFPSVVTYVLAAVSCASLLILHTRRRPRYPPGPKGLPIVGNLLDVPTHNAWIKYKQLGKKYGSDIIHFEVFGSHIVVLNSTTVARDILEKRSQISSDRTHSVMLNELSGWAEERNFGFMRYGDGWRRQRRLFQQHFRRKAVAQYHAIQSKSVHSLLNALLDRPERFIANLRFMAGSMILRIVYGTDIQPGDSRLTLVEKAVGTLVEVMNAGVFLVDVFPILKHIPSWMPGAGFKRKAAEWKTLVDDMYEVPYNDFKASVSLNVLLGVPHRTIADDEYNGYFIPAGTTIIANAWAMLHDEERYPDPETFIPERFLNKDGTLRSDACIPLEPFGFGRRICPGRYFAEDIVWLAIASILSVFRVEPPVDEHGEPLKQTATFGTRFLSAPTPFKCCFTLRYPEAEGLIRASATSTA